MMKIEIDTDALGGPNEFGETLRKYCFTEEYGCYSCFELIDEFQEAKFGDREFELIMGRPHDLQRSEADEYWGWDDQFVFNSARWHKSTKNDIEIGWFWDGDGALFIRCGDKAAINHDCKKDYCWEWAEEG